MMDTSTIERYMRDANPIPHVDDVDPEEFARFVAAAHTKRAAVMSATTRHQITPPTAPRSQRRRSVAAWALTAGFVLVLLVLGATALFLRGDDTPVADEPAPPPTVTTAATDDRDLAAVVDGWQPIDNPWLVRDETSIAPLPGGGFVAASWLEHPDGSYVMWSPDGLNWFDGDPHRRLPHQDQEDIEFMWSPVMAVAGDQVIILAADIIPGRSALTVWIGDPRTGSWGPMTALVDTSGLAGQLVSGLITISAGTDRALVAALTAPELPPDGSAPDEIESVVVWLVDPKLGTATRTNLPVGTPFEGTNATVWFDGRWHVMLPLVTVGFNWVETALWSSPDGMTWTEDEFPEGWRTTWLNWPTTGPSGVVTCAVIDGNEETDGMWFSPNGVDWRFISSIPNYCRGVYSDSLGFVLEGAEDGFYRLSPDGETLEVLVTPFPADPVAASGNNLIVDTGRSMSPWLYHQPDDE